MMPIRGVIFDLDGTLLNTLDDLAAAVNAALTAHGMPCRSLDEVRQFVGNGVEKLMARSVPEGTDTDMAAAVFVTFRTFYAAHNRDKTAPYDGILPMLASLRDAGLHVAIVTNKLDSATQTLRDIFFSDTVDVALGDTPARPRKPAPDSTYAALDALGISADEAVFVGDSDVDVATARNAGMRCIAVSWGFRSASFLRRHGAAVIADTPSELANMILQGSV